METSSHQIEKSSQELTNPVLAVQRITQKYFRTDLPALEVGDKVKITTRGTTKNEKGEYNFTSFGGTIIAQKNRQQISYTFTVLKESDKVVVKAVFYYHSPLIIKIEKLGKIKLNKKGKSRKIRRAKLYFLERQVVKKQS